jgi:hypothetical protein
MGQRCRFVQPSVVRLPLSDGEYVDVKQELTAGEQRRIFSQLVKEMHAGEKTVLDPEQVGKTKLLEYIVGWSFLGLDGQPAPVCESTIDCLDTDTYRELVDAVDAHELRSEQARAARKNGQGGEKVSPAISPLPSEPAGPSITSVN